MVSQSSLSDRKSSRVPRTLLRIPTDLKGNEGVLFPKLQHYLNLTIKLYSVIYRKLTGGVLNVCRDEDNYYYYYCCFIPQNKILKEMIENYSKVHNRPPFPKKGDLGLAKNYRGITLTSITAKIYNALLRNRIEPKIDNILRKNQNGLRRNRSTTAQILTIRRILEGVRAKSLQATLLFVDFTNAFDSIHRGKTEQILLVYSLPKETVAAITILYRNTKVKVRSPDGDRILRHCCRCTTRRHARPIRL